MKHSRERIKSSPFFINILILERGSGMKSFSAFIAKKRNPKKPQGVNQADVSKTQQTTDSRNSVMRPGGPTTGRTGKKSSLVIEVVLMLRQGAEPRNEKDSPVLSLVV